MRFDEIVRFLGQAPKPAEVAPAPAKDEEPAPKAGGLFADFIRWAFGDSRKSHGIRLRHIGPLEVELDEETTARLSDLPMIYYGHGIYAWFRSDDFLFPENEPQRSIGELEAELPSLDEQLHGHMYPKR